MPRLGQTVGAHHSAHGKAPVRGPNIPSSQAPRGCAGGWSGQWAGLGSVVAGWPVCPARSIATLLVAAGGRGHRTAYIVCDADVGEGPTCGISDTRTTHASPQWDAVLQPVSPLLLGIGDVVDAVVLQGSYGSFFCIPDDKVKMGQPQVAQLCVAQTKPFARNDIPHAHVTLNAVRAIDLDQGRVQTALPV